MIHLIGLYIPGQAKIVKYKHNLVFPKTTQKIVPGPGAHEIVDNLDAIGKYHQSKRKNSRAKVFNPPHSKRFSKSSKRYI